MNESIFYKNRNLNGQSQCHLCRIKGKFNVSWSSMMWCSDVLNHQYCDDCKKEYEEADEDKKFYIKKTIELYDKAKNTII